MAATRNGGMVQSAVAGLVVSVVSLVVHLVGLDPAAVILAVAASLLAAVGILGSGARSIVGACAVLFTGLSGGAFAAALPVGLLLLPWWVWLAGFALYLIAATFYGFAGDAQGVEVGARVGLLLLLLLAVLPLVQVLGLAGILVTAVRRTTR